MLTKIRPATPADVPGLFAVRTSVTENDLTREALFELGITEESITEMILAADCAWVAIEGARVVGFAMIIPEESCLFAAFVLPEYEGRGLGKRLVNAAEQALFQNSDVAWLETGETTRAAGFYRHLGWGNEQNVGDGDIRLEKHRQEQ